MTQDTATRPTSGPKRKKAPKIFVEPADFGTPALARHHEMELEEYEPNNPGKKHARNVTQSMIDRYRRRGTLELHQIDAAEKHLALYILSGRHPASTMSFQGRVNGGGAFLQDEKIAAGHARDRALMHLKTLDQEYASIVEHVCIEEHSAEGWAIGRKLHPMKGIKTLRIALDALAKHYGIRVV